MCLFLAYQGSDRIPACIHTDVKLGICFLRGRRPRRKCLVGGFQGYGKVVKSAGPPVQG